MSLLSPAMWGDRQVADSGAVNIRIDVPHRPVATVDMVDAIECLPEQ